MACVEDHTTPKIRVRDDFSAVLVTGLGEGDEVRMTDDATSIDILLASGISPFPKLGAGFIRFHKRSGTSPKATSVEIHRGG